MRERAPEIELCERTFVDTLADFGDAMAMVDGDVSYTYAELDAAVDRRGLEIGSERCLVLITAANEIDPLITYLAALKGRHPVMLVPPNKPLEPVLDAFRPGFVDRADEHGLRSRRRIEHAPGADGAPIPEMHPELALMLSTSGSTGSSKYVRMSRANLQANASSIAEFLDIRPTDRVATSLPLHFCYGLSVVHSHLIAGAGIVLTDHSVLDPEFWADVDKHQVSTFPGVPFTFELLDRMDFEHVDAPSLRYITQSGGRLPVDTVRRYAEMGRRKGFDLFVMYGQTEATARMAYLPPAMAAEHPHVVGQAIPGGSFRIDEDTSEIIYSGPNVMMGYAHSAADLDRGPELTELRTGDLGRRTESGFYEITGRSSRFLKLFGLRIGLDDVESFLTGEQISAVATGDDDRLVIAVTDPNLCESTRSVASKRFGLPQSSISVLAFDEVPRLANGKPDYVAIRAEETRRRAATASTDPTGPAAADDLIGAIQKLLDVPHIGEDDTFVSLGGDSLSYIEAALLIEDALGRVPNDWHTTPLLGLAAREPATPSRWFRSIETNVGLRALAILLVLSAHFELASLEGGAHVLLAVSGYNFSRFVLRNVMRIDEPFPISNSLVRVVIPTMGWVLLIGLMKGGDVTTSALFLVSNFDAGAGTGFWFIEVLVQLLLAMTLIMAIPQARSLNRRSPYLFAVGMLALSYLARFGIESLWSSDHLGFKVPHMSFWLFCLGWVADRSDSTQKRLWLTLVALATIPGFFESDVRTAVIAAGVFLLIWFPTLRVPAVSRRAVALVASSSLYLYLTHLQVRTLLPIEQPVVLFTVAVIFGLVAAAVAEFGFRFVLGSGSAGRGEAHHELDTGVGDELHEELQEPSNA